MYTGALLTRATAAESRLSQLEDLEGGDGDMDGDGDYGYDDGESSFRAADPYQNHRGVTSSSSSGMAGMGDTAFPSSSASGTPSKQLHLSVGGRLEKRRPTRSTKMISEFEKFGVHGNHSVAKVRRTNYNYRQTSPYNPSPNLEPDPLTSNLKPYPNYPYYPHHRICGTKAIDGIDSLLRLGFVLYLVMLHLWVLSHRTHTLYQSISIYPSPSCTRSLAHSHSLSHSHSP